MRCKIEDLSIYYEEYGSGKPVLCLHGFTEDHLSMKGSLEPIFTSVSGFRRIYIDMPGMGKTVAKDWVKNADIMLDILKKFTKKVIKEDEFLIIGASYGGYLALGMACDIELKVGGLFLLGPLLFAEVNKRMLPVVKESEKYIEDGIKKELESFGDTGFYDSSAIIMNEDTWSRYQAEFLPSYLSYDREFTKKFRENGYILSCEQEFSRLEFTKPITVLTGKQDESTGYEDSWEVLKHLPRLSYLALDSVGHLLALENPDVFNALLKDWINKVA